MTIPSVFRLQVVETAVVFSGAVECSPSEGGGDTTAQSSSPSSLTGSSQGTDRGSSSNSTMIAVVIVKMAIVMEYLTLVIGVQITHTTDALKKETIIIKQQQQRISRSSLSSSNGNGNQTR